MSSTSSATWLMPTSRTVMASWKHEVEVAELVPEVAERARGRIRACEQLASRRRFEHEEVRGLRLVPAGQEPVDGAQAALGCDDEARDALGRCDGAVGVGSGLERAYGGRADGDDPAAPGVRGVDEPGG